MSQHDMNLANADGATFRADANNALVALVSNSSGATAPSTTFAFQWWADTANDVLKVRNAANSAWVEVITLSTGAPIGGTGDSDGLFYKADSGSVVFTKTGNSTLQIKAGTKVWRRDGTVQEFASATSVTMPSLSAGTDYVIYVCDDASLRADSNFSAPSGYSTSNSRKIGGFHYAPGENATGTSGGNTTAAINEYSLWDLKWRPSAADPRGMTLVGGGFWADIYLTGVDAITNGSSKYNVTIADGSSPPKVPTMFGGNGSTTYGSYTWFEAMELATAFGKRCPTQQEFMALAYGTTEASSIGSDPVSTAVASGDATYTSKWGCFHASGCMWIWARDRGGPYAGASWNANTESRGSEYNAPNAARLGGNWSGGSISGSRCSLWIDAASVSSASFGSRFVCDHLQLA